MMRLALRAAALVLLLGAGVCAWIWDARRALEYNEEGRHFNAADAIVLHEQAVTVYGGLALAFAFIGACCALVSARL